MPVGPGIRSLEPDALARSFGLAHAAPQSATEPRGVGVRQVKLANALPRVSEHDSDRRSFAFRYLVAGLVTHANRLARHRISSPIRFGNSYHVVPTLLTADS